MTEAAARGNGRWAELGELKECPMTKSELAALLSDRPRKHFVIGASSFGFRHSSRLSSALPQKLHDLLRQLRPNPLHLRNLRHPRPPNPRHRPEMLEQKLFPPLRHAGAIIQDALRDPAFHQ